MPSTQVGMITQQTTPAAHLMPDISNALSYLEPDLYPLDTMTRRAGSGPKAEAEYVQWGMIDSMPRTDTLTQAETAGDPGAAKVWHVDHASRWRINDTIRIIGSDGLPTAAILLVTAVAASTITVYNLGVIASDTGMGTVPAVAEDQVIMWLGSALYEGAGPSNPRASMPYYNGNYIEYSDHVVAISDIRQNTKNWTGVHDWTNAQKESLKEFRRSQEYKKKWGKASMTLDPVSGEKRWTMNGVTEYITKLKTYNKTAINGQRITELWIIDLLAYVFGGNNGSKTRVLLADTYLNAEILKVPLTAMRSRATKEVLGVVCEEMTFNLGTVYVAHDRSINEVGLEHYGILLDMEQVQTRDMIPMHKTVINYKDQGYEKQGEKWSETSTMQIDKVAAHCIIQGVEDQT